MSQTPLHMLDLRFDLAQLWRMVRHDGKALADADLGYAVHAALFQIFGADHAPKPFALEPVESGSRLLRVLAYAPVSADELTAMAPLLALNETLVHLGSKVLPRPDQWRPGTRLKFRVQARPTVRGHKIGADGKERDLEVDAYQSEINQVGLEGARSREQVYVAWLGRQFAALGGAEVLHSELEGWRLAPLYRKGAGVLGKPGARRGTRLMSLPEAGFAGTLAVTDGEQFHALLSRGIGRHRAFGHGMLLIRPE